MPRPGLVTPSHILLDTLKTPLYPGGTVYPRGGEKMQGEQMRLFVERWPRDLHRRVKSQAALRGLTVRQAYVDAATAWVKNGKGRR